MLDSPVLGTLAIANHQSMSNNNPPFDNHNLPILLIAAGLAAILVTMHHCIAVCWSSGQRQQSFVTATVLENSSSFNNNSAAHLIPAHKYEKGTSLRGEDGTCAVCLCEFEEGDELPTLPGCMHSFHVPCIDMWLYSHTSCPMCRSDGTPSPSPMISRGGLDLESGEVVEEESETLQELVQSS